MSLGWLLGGGGGSGGDLPRRYLLGGIFLEAANQKYSLMIGVRVWHAISHIGINK